MSGAASAGAVDRQVDDKPAVFEGILPGRYTLEDHPRHFDGSPRIFSCRAHRIDADYLCVEGPVRGRIGEHVRAWIEHFDVLNGIITEVQHRSFRIRLRMSPKAREKLAGKITWVRRHILENLPDQRANLRLPMPDIEPVVILGDGTIHDCFVIDVSESGAAVSADLELDTGTRCAVGCIVGTVVRQLETGFAVKFDDTQDRESLRRVLGWMPPDYGDKQCAPFSDSEPD